MADSCTQCDDGRLTARLAKRFTYKFPDDIFSVMVTNCEVNCCNKCSYRHLLFDNSTLADFNIACMKQMVRLPFIMSGNRFRFLGSFLTHLLDKNLSLARYVGFYPTFSRMQDLEMSFEEVHLEDDGEDDKQKERGAQAHQFWYEAKSCLANKLGISAEQMDDICNYRCTPQHVDCAIKLATLAVEGGDCFRAITEPINGIYVTIIDAGCFPHFIT